MHEHVVKFSRLHPERHTPTYSHPFTRSQITHTEIYTQIHTHTHTHTHARAHTHAQSEAHRSCKDKFVNYIEEGREGRGGMVCVWVGRGGGHNLIGFVNNDHDKARVGREQARELAQHSRLAYPRPF